MQVLAAWLPIAAWVAYAALGVAAAARVARREPRVAALATALALLAVALRFAVAPRLPMVGQSADLEPLNGVLSWLAGQPQWGGGGHSPAAPALLYLVLAVVGASFEAAFAVTTVLGGLLVLPVFAIARRLGGSLSAAVLAALAAAVLPLGVIFSNGVNSEIPMAFCLAAVLQHALAFADEERPADAARLALALLLYAQTRPDALLDLPAVLAGLAVLVVASGRTATLLRQRALWLAVAGGAALAGPFLRVVAGSVPVQHASEVDVALARLVWLVPGVLALGLAGGRLLQAARERRWLWLVLALGLAAVAAGRAAALVDAYGPEVFGPRWRPFLTLPPDWVRAGVATWTYGAAGDARPDDPWMFPSAWLVPALLGVLPARRPGAPRAAAAGGLVVALLILVRWHTLATCAPRSGELISDGARHLVPVAGLLAVVTGLGAAHLARLVTPSALRRAAPILAGALLLSPLLTHRAVLTDVAFDQQERYAFVRRTFPALLPGTLLLVPDHLIYPEVRGGYDGGAAYLSSRTPALCGCTRRLLGGPEACRGFREWAASGADWPGPLALFVDLDCLRTRTGLPDPLCERLSTLPGLLDLGRARLANRPYDRYPLSNVGEVDLALREVPYDRVGEVRDLVVEHLAR